MPKASQNYQNVCQKCPKCVPKVMPNRGLSERCTTSFGPPHTVWKALLRLHLSYKNPKSMEFRSILRITPNPFKVCPKRPKAGQMAPNMVPNGSPDCDKIHRKSDWLHLGRRPPPKADTGLPQCSQMAAKIMESRRAEEHQSRRVEQFSSMFVGLR